jgi:DNA-binding NarL/FixJ family response regulator
MELTELMASVSRVEHKLEEQTQQLKLLTQIVTFLSEKISTTTSQDGAETTSHSVATMTETPNTLFKLTLKQHGTLQMLLDGKSNFEIAKRFDVSEDTAKVYVRTIAKKYGVNTRAQIVMATLEEFNSVGDDVYQRISGGLPKDWHSNFSEPDPFADLYSRKKHEPKSKS